MSILDEYIDTVWRAELHRRVLAGKNEGGAWTEIVQECVDACEPRPLVWAIKANRRSSAIERIIVSLFAEGPLSNVETPTVINVASARPGARVLNGNEERWMNWLNIDIQTLLDDRLPNRFFWGTMSGQANSRGAG